VVAGRLGSPGYKAERALKAALLPEGDPGLRQATPETVSSLTWKDVKDYYSKVFRPDMTTIVVIGGVTPEAARKVVEKYFGKWKAPEGPRPETLLPPVPLNGPSGKLVPNEHRIQDRVTLAQTLGLNRSHPDYYALQLGNRILGGGFYATRLYRDLRQNAGLVYNVSTSFSMTQTRGFYTVQYGCEPVNTGKARAIVERNLKYMQTALASAEELQRAKVLLLREIPLSESSVDTIGWGLIGRTELELPLDEPVLAARRYVELGPEQVREAFARWIRVDDLVQVIEGPEPR
jgi:zinc protease